MGETSSGSVSFGPSSHGLDVRLRWNTRHQGPLALDPLGLNGRPLGRPLGAHLGAHPGAHFGEPAFRRASSVKSGPAGRDFNASVRNKRAKTKQAKALLGYA